MNYLNYLTDKEIVNTDDLKNGNIHEETTFNGNRENLFNKGLGGNVLSEENTSKYQVKYLKDLKDEEDRNSEELEVIFNHNSEIETTKVTETKMRNGHTTIYCKRLEQTMERCPITGISDLSLLRHSHIKPWSVSTDEEKLDGYNGLLLEYGYDMLFDRGWITFENDGTLLVSPRIPKELLSIYWLLRHGKTYNIYNSSGKRSKYLEYHRQNIFKG